ncbi:GNAT family N-acetyltransferase [Francisella frigiditurris]|uniref:Acetyltransferase family protein n=1 Tax=Francisella frigiditurris TaxID=1542390 RepID=A0A1J0KUT9_9GAMM|nr:GNAT family N-acetyltransferase [Francisella frigiditurris]APC97521.1 acetyltransferase family protein [Francisella frigiditurris]
MKLEKAQEKDFDEMIDLWQASVETTHEFLTIKDISKLRKLIRSEYFYIQELSIEVLKNDNKVIGFLGTEGNNIEMLFISPEFFGKGIGQLLLKHAIKNKNCTKVDVNEQNPRALRFYEKYGFKVKSRSPLDSQGNPFPILHMELVNA